MFGFFERLVDPFEGDADHRQSATISDFIREQIYGLKKYMCMVALCAMCIAATEVYIFTFLGELVDTIADSSAEIFFMENKVAIIQLCLILLVGLPLAAFGSTIFWHQTLAGNLPVSIISVVHQRLLKQSVQFYQIESAGKVANTLLQTAVSIKMVILASIYTLVFAVVFFISMAIVLSGIDLYLLLPVFVWTVGHVVVIRYFIPKLKLWSSREAGDRSEMVGQLVDTYSNIATVKLFSHTNIEKSYARSYMSKYLHSVNGQMRFMSKVLFMMWFLNITLIFSTIASSIFLWGVGLITAGAIAAAVGVTFRAYTMSNWITWEISGVFSNLGVIHDGIKLLSKPLPKSAIEVGDSVSIPEYSISFENIDFSYAGNNRVLERFSLSIRAGEKMGIVGRSGSGKSTLVKLLLRFYEIDNGKISIGGLDISKLNHGRLLEKIAVVSQDVELLDRSVRENLTYGKSGLSEKEIIDAAKAAGAHEFILGIVDDGGRKGYDAHVGVRGARLSGGQRQRISLARTLLKDAPIIIFDEATSALDSETESYIMNHTRPYLKGKTVIVIAHRLTTLTCMDRLAVIDKGKLVEIGSHEELKVKKGFYQKMLQMQSDRVLDVA